MKVYLAKAAEFLRKEKYILLSSVVSGFAITFVCAYILAFTANAAQAGIGEKVLRFHILANSNTEEDQALKLALRDALFERYSGLSEAEEAGEAISYLSERLADIEEFSESFILEQGYDYGVCAAIVKESFPTRAYGDLSFPAGNYAALRITIGSGEGDNFWCVMFPPLCFIDVARGEITDESKAALKKALGAEEYALISKNGYDVKLKFKLLEIISKLCGK